MSHHVGISNSRTPLKRTADDIAMIADQDKYEVDPKRSLAITQKILEGWRTLSDLICRSCRNVLFGHPRTKEIECLWCEKPYQMSDQSIHSRPELRYSSTKVKYFHILKYFTLNKVNRYIPNKLNLIA